MPYMSHSEYHLYMALIIFALVMGWLWIASQVREIIRVTNQRLEARRSQNQWHSK